MEADLLRSQLCVEADIPAHRSGSQMSLIPRVKSPEQRVLPERQEHIRVYMNIYLPWAAFRAFGPAYLPSMNIEKSWGLRWDFAYRLTWFVCMYGCILFHAFLQCCLAARIRQLISCEAGWELLDSRHCLALLHAQSSGHVWTWNLISNQEDWCVSNTCTRRRASTFYCYIVMFDWCAVLTFAKLDWPSFRNLHGWISIRLNLSINHCTSNFDKRSCGRKVQAILIYTTRDIT